MNRNKIIILILILLTTFYGFSLFKKSVQEVPTDTWKVFTDETNGWEISYPSSISNIKLVDDIGARNWLNNIVFETDNKWVFSVWVATTTHINREEYVAANSNQDTDDKNRSTFVKNGKVFIIRTNSDAPTEKILGSLKTEN